MDPLIVLVLEGEYRLTAAVLFCLSLRPEITVHVVSREAASPFRYSRYVAGHHGRAGAAFDADFVAFALGVAGRTGAQVLLPVDVEGMRFALAHGAALETGLRVLPLPAADAYETAADKGRLAAFMERHGIPGPATLALAPADRAPHRAAHLAARLAGLRFPVLLKPVAGAGGQGIVRFADAAALLAHAAGLPPGGHYVVQTYLDGYDIDCNVLCHDGRVLAHSIQRGLLGAAHAYGPTQAIEFVPHAAVLAVASRLLAALRWSGVAHLDLRCAAATQEVNVIEINPRFWLTVVGSAVTARVNFPVLACLAALGRPLAQGPAAPGRYIPFGAFVKYKYGSRAKDKVRFGFGDTSLRGFLGDPLPKLICWLAPQRVRLE